MTPRFYTVKEAATLIGFNPDTVRQWCREGRIRAVKGEGRTSRYRIPASALVEWENRNTYNPAA